MNFIKKELPMLLILLLPFVIIAIFWNAIPDQLPIYWNLQSEVDTYASKWPGLFFLPFANICIYLLFLGVPRIDIHRANLNLFKKSFYGLRLGIVSLLFMLWMTFFLWLATCFRVSVKIQIQTFILLWKYCNFKSCYETICLLVVWRSQKMFFLN